MPRYLNFLTPQILKMGDLILLTLIKMQPQNSQSSRENATPSSGTSHQPITRKYPHPLGGVGGSSF